MKSAFVLFSLWLTLLIHVSNAKEIVVGQDAGGWSIGVKYEPINAVVGDKLSFKYTSGVHDVWTLPSPECNFDAPGAKLVGTPSAGSYVANLDKPGKYYYACSVVGHCDAGQLLEVNVAAAGEPGTASPNPPVGPKPGSSNKPVGSCSAPQTVNATTNEMFVSCRSPPISLAPGDNVYPDVLLPNPYPDPSTAQEVILETIAAEVVRSDGTPVPLSEVYLHHIFGDVRFVPAEGAEVRHSPMRQVLPAPFFLPVNTTIAANDNSRYANFHVIRTTGVAPDAIKSCIECWCENTNPQTGSIGCCSTCPTTSTDPPQDYYLEFNVTYKMAPNGGIIEETPDMKRATALVLDIHGGVEYSVAPVPTSVEASLAIPTSTFNRTYALDFFCPQTNNFTIVKCWGHQHIGAECVSIIDTATGYEICKSCPTYGTSPGVPGDEEGYVVGMSSTVLDPPYVVQPGQQVALTSTYAADQPYAGVMSLYAVILGDFDARPECSIDFSGFVQPPGNLDGTSSDMNGTGLSTEEIITEAATLIGNVPDSCTSFKGYLNNTVLPCLPAAVEAVQNNGMAMSGMGPGGGMEKIATCCTAMKAHMGGISNILGQVFSSSDVPTECLCGLGEVLLFGYRQNLLPKIAAFSDTCTGRDSMGGGQDASSTVTSGLALLLNSVFAPKCPNIAAEINNVDSGSVANSTTQVPTSSTDAGNTTTTVDGSGSSSSGNAPSSAAVSSFARGILLNMFVVVVSVVSVVMMPWGGVSA